MSEERTATAAPEQRTATVEVENVRTDGKTLHGFACLYGAESRDLGGFTERIEPGAFSDALAADPDVLLTFNHSPDKVLARTRSGTLKLSDEARGLAFEAELGDGPTAQDVRDMVRRGDLSGASFRFVVAPGGETWQGERRTLTKVAELIDVSLATTPAYDGPSVELRTRPETTDKPAPPETTDTAPAEKEDNMDTENTENRTIEGGGLAVEDRSSTPRPKGLAEEFRAAGFPGETATVSFDRFAESRAVTWTGSVDKINAVQASAGPFGADERFAWPAFPQVSVDAGATSVDVMTQTARSLATPASVVRAIDAITTKPETGSTLTVVTTALKQVASIYSGVPNIHLEQPAFNTIIETDLRLAINGGLDKLILDSIATSGFQAPGTDPLLISIRKAITTVQASGYSPNTLLLRPADAEALDTLRATATAGDQYYVFSPAQLAPRNIFGLNVRIAKDIPAPAVVDSTALGKLYASPLTLARFEADGGTTNKQNIRLELNAVFGTERTAAAVRIAAA